jgi:hypothetical protein
VLCIAPVFALAQAPAHTLPAGTRLDFIADDSINFDTVRLGGQFRLHLARDFTLDGTTLALAGTPAHLLVSDKSKKTDGTIVLSISLSDFHLRQGALPVAAVSADITALAPGTIIPAITQGSIERTPERIVIRVPAAVPLSNVAPASAYNARPAATPAPFVPAPQRSVTPTPLPTTFNPPDAGAAPNPATT